MGVQGGGGGNQSQQSIGYDYQTQLQQQLSGSQQSVWGPQGTALTGLYGQAGNLARAQGNVGATAAQKANQVLPGAQAGMTALQGIARGGGPLAAYAKPNNALAKTQMDVLGQGIGDQFRREILPSLRTGAGMAGGIGGSRDKLAQGLAAGESQKAYASGAADLLGTQYGIGAQAAAGQTDAMSGAAQALPGMATSIYNLGMQPLQAAWAPLMAASGIFGDPTTLAQQFGISQSTGAGESWTKGASAGRTKPQWGFSLF